MNTHTYIDERVCQHTHIHIRYTYRFMLACPKAGTRYLVSVQRRETATTVAVVTGRSGRRRPVRFQALNPGDSSSAADCCWAAAQD